MVITSIRLQTLIWSLALVVTVLANGHWLLVITGLRLSSLLVNTLVVAILAIGLYYAGRYRAIVGIWLLVTLVFGYVVTTHIGWRRRHQSMSLPITTTPLPVKVIHTNIIAGQ